MWIFCFRTWCSNNLEEIKLVVLSAGMKQKTNGFLRVWQLVWSKKLHWIVAWWKSARNLYTKLTTLFQETLQQLTNIGQIDVCLLKQQTWRLNFRITAQIPTWGKEHEFHEFIWTHMWEYSLSVALIKSDKNQPRIIRLFLYKSLNQNILGY